MTLERLAIHGLLRFEATCAIDFTTLPVGVIAIVGPNGAGKTSLLEAATAALYRSFPTRDGRELFDYAHGRDGYVDATFALEGRGQYRARVNVDGLKRTSDAILEHVQGDVRRILNDGKVSTFDQRIAELFPPAAVLYASAFATQNRSGSFATIDKRGRKALFAALLNLDHLEAMAQTARTAASLVESGRTALEARRDLLRREAAPGIRAALEGTVQQWTRERDMSAETYAAASAQVQALDATREQLQADVARAAAAAEREQAARQALAELDAQRTVLRDRAARLERESAAAIAAAEAEGARALQDLDARLANNRAVLADSVQIREAVARAEALDTELAAVRTRQADAQASAERARQTLREAERALADLDRLAADRARAVEVSALRDTVPCAGAGAYAACQFLTRATAAAEKIPALDTALEARTGVEVAHQVAMTALRTIEEERTTIERELRALVGQRDALQPWVAKAAPLAAADARVTELERQRVETADRIAVQVADLRAKATDQLKASADELEALTARRQQLVTALDAAAADVATLEPARVQAARVTLDLADARARAEQAAADQARAEASLAELARRREALDALDAQLQDIETRLATLGTELVSWQLLAKALGRDGLPVLEIDAAGPTVSAICNDLLTASFGPRFTVELVTQAAKADGKGLKEVFELKVWDNQRGGEARDLSDLSGGEQVLVDESLKNAIAVFLNQRNQTPIRTLWRDECTAPLDHDNALRYFAMLRRVREIGGFHQALVVTHNAEAAALADAQLHVGPGGVRVVLPPYSRSEAA